MDIKQAASMRHALDKTRALDPIEATRLIQASLGGGPRQTLDSQSGGIKPTMNLAQPRKLRFSRLSIPNINTATLARPGAHRHLPEAAIGTKTGSYRWRALETTTDSRDYRIYIPRSFCSKAAGLIVMLHGCTQNSDDFAIGTRMNVIAGKEDFIIAYPLQKNHDNPQSCWNWFKPEHQKRGGGEPAFLAHLAIALGNEFDVPASRRFIAGLSAGGAMAAIVAEAYPDVFAGAGVHSGLAPRVAHDVASAFRAMRKGGHTSHFCRRPLIVFHGDTDQIVVPSNGASLVPGSGIETKHEGNGRKWSRIVAENGSELWRVQGAGHAWFGGDPSGSYTDPLGPDSSKEMVDFFKRIAVIAQ